MSQKGSFRWLIWEYYGDYNGPKDADCFLRYFLAKLARQNSDTAYRAYITDALRMTTENTAKYAGGVYQKSRWFDLANPPKEETRTAEEIIEHMKKKLEGVT